MLVRAEERFPYRGPQIATLPEIDGDLYRRLRTIWRCRNDEALTLTVIGQRLALFFTDGPFRFGHGNHNVLINSHLYE